MAAAAAAAEEIEENCSDIDVDANRDVLERLEEKEEVETAAGAAAALTTER